MFEVLNRDHIMLECTKHSLAFAAFIHIQTHTQTRARARARASLTNRSDEASQELRDVLSPRKLIFPTTPFSLKSFNNPDNVALMSALRSLRRSKAGAAPRPALGPHPNFGPRS